MEDLCTLIMAAGKGTRMISRRAKVLHEVCGIPMLRLVYQAAAGMDPQSLIVVIGQDAEHVRMSLAGLPAEFVHQEKQLGTGHAVICAREKLAALGGDVLVLSGDTPRIRTGTLQQLVRHHRESGATTTLLTTCPPDPRGYGRIVRGAPDAALAIVEEKDATGEQKTIREINAGIYCFRIAPLLAALERITSNNEQGEFYLTDVVKIQSSGGLRVEAMPHPDFEELQGINTRRELALAAKALWKEKALGAMAAGVTLIDPETSYIGPDVTLESDVTIFPGVMLEGTTFIAGGSIIRGGSRISNSWIGSDVEVRDSCVISDSRVGRGSIVGPFAHVRNQCTIGDGCIVGSYVELARSAVDAGSSIPHMSYLGDAQVGKGVVIGAGAITCNFDGWKKSCTVIEDGAFIGTDSQLVAPVRIGRDAFVAAGSCITRDVPAAALAVGRARQVQRPGWALRRLRRREKGK